MKLLIVFTLDEIERDDINHTIAFAGYLYYIKFSTLKCDHINLKKCIH